MLGASSISIHARDKLLPSRAETPTSTGIAISFEENARTRLAIAKIPTRPMLVRDDIAARDSPAIGQCRGEASGAVESGCLAKAIPEFADFDPNTLTIAYTTVIRMITLFRWQEVFYRFPVINCEMPHDPTGPAKPRVVLAAFAFYAEVISVIRRGGIEIGRAMNRYVARPHRSGDETPMHIWRQKRQTHTWHSSALILHPRRTPCAQHGQTCKGCPTDQFSSHLLLPRFSH
jgi:hypothetical protein